MASNENVSLPKIGFKFNKVNKPKSTFKPIHHHHCDDDEPKEVLEFVTSIDDKNEIHGSGNHNNKFQKSTDSRSLVIPHIAVNRYRVNKSTNKSTKTTLVSTSEEAKPSSSSSSFVPDVNINSQEDLQTKAKRELLEEAKQHDNDNDNLNVPAWKLMVINKVPSEYENDDKLDVSIRPEEPTLDDYQNMPVEAFGSALLRGMGWTEGLPIGGRNKAVTPIHQPKLRPKGLGLGADASLMKQLQEKGSNKNNNNNKEGAGGSVLQTGSHVCIELGNHKGQYGTVVYITDDLSLVQVKLSLTKETVQLPEVLLRVVTKKEFDQDGRVINKLNYDEYHKNHHENQPKHHHHKISGSEERRKSDKNHNKNHSHREQQQHWDHDNTTDNNNNIWIMPRIWAQIIDKRYKNGKYYKQRIVIMETSADKCTGCCTTSSNTKQQRILTDISQSMLRTVIPHHDDDDNDDGHGHHHYSRDRVMILRGEYRGKLALIDKLDWHRNKVTVKLVGIITKSITLTLDDISQYCEQSI